LLSRRRASRVVATYQVCLSAYSVSASPRRQTLETPRIEEPDRLTEMQKQVGRLATLGKSEREIAERLLISPSAVRTILRRIEPSGGTRRDAAEGDRRS